MTEATQHADTVAEGIPVIRWLLARAESYWRDADAFAEAGDAPMSAAYRAIADELRRCVVEVGR